MKHKLECCLCINAFNNCLKLRCIKLYSASLKGEAASSSFHVLKMRVISAQKGMWKLRDHSIYKLLGNETEMIRADLNSKQQLEMDGGWTWSNHLGCDLNFKTINCCRYGSTPHSWVMSWCEETGWGLAVKDLVVGAYRISSDHRQSVKRNCKIKLISWICSGYFRWQLLSIQIGTLLLEVGNIAMPEGQWVQINKVKPQYESPINLLPFRQFMLIEEVN